MTESLLEAIAVEAIALSLLGFMTWVMIITATALSNTTRDDVLASKMMRWTAFGIICGFMVSVLISILVVTGR